MHISYFGDSYDIVKQSLIRWLAPFGPWSVHPMFTEETDLARVCAFERFLGATVLSNAPLTAKADRLKYFDCALTCGNLFLDPDTGLKLVKVSGTRGAKFLFASELLLLIQKRPGFLTIVFDQSHPRGKAVESLNEKLRYLSNQGVSAFAYTSHACFILAGSNSGLVERARDHLLAESRLPKNRFVCQSSCP